MTQTLTMKTETVILQGGGGFASTPGQPSKKQLKAIENKAIQPEDEKAKEKDESQK